MRRKVSVAALVAVILSAFCMVPPVVAGTPHAVDVQNFSFNPDDLVVEVGETVQWSNLEGTHNIVADDGSFSSGAPDSGAWTFDHTFDGEGTFAYHCTLHGGPGGVGMAGVITVQGTGDQGSVTVIKTTVGGDETFEFSSDLPDNAEFSITTTDGSGQHGPVTVDAGIYAITESNPPGWTLAAASCDNGDTPDEVTVGAGTDVTCTFDNRSVSVYEDRFEDIP